MKIKSLIPILFLFLLVLPSVFAEPPVLQLDTDTLSIVYPKQPYVTKGEDYTLNFHVYNSSGYLLTNTSVSCDLHIYNNSGAHLVFTNLSFSTTDNDFYYNLNGSYINQTGIYSYLAHCNDTEAGFVSATFEVTKDGKPYLAPSGLMVVIMIVPLFFSLLCLFGAATLNEEHVALKIGLFLLSFPPLFATLHLGMIFITCCYDLPSVEAWIGTTTYWIGIFLFALITYFGFYAFFKISQQAKQDKKEKLRY